MISDKRASGEDAILTLPNLITLTRLALLPVALYLAVTLKDYIFAAALLAFIGTTDFIDGYVARRLNQVSELGKIMDPSVDRIVILALGITAVVSRWIPLELGVMILIREGFISGVSAYLFKVKHRRLDVIWFGKAGTLVLLVALPIVVLAQQHHPNLGLLHPIGLGLAWFGTVVLYLAAIIYIKKDLIPAILSR